MKRAVFLLLIFLILPIFSYGQEGPQEEAVVTFFYSPHCNACFKIKEEIFPPLMEKYEDKVSWQLLDTFDSENLSLLEAVTDYFGGQTALVPAILVGNSFLVGLVSIEENINAAIEAAFKEGEPQLKFPKKDLVSIFEKISVFTIMGSGLIDGINPCAFAVIVFFISFLSVYGYRKRDMAWVGTFYCLAVFISYLLLGLGFFRFLYALKNIYIVIKLFYYFVAIFCFTIGIVTFIDYLRYRKSGRPEDTILQLPVFFKKKINVAVGTRLREKKKRSVVGLAAASFSIGILVSLLEAVCTGQVYIPIIVFILKNTDLQVKAAMYLLLYNLMFIFPLIAIFILSLIGVKHISFSNFLKRNLGKIKILMVFVFFILGALILVLS